MDMSLQERILYAEKMDEAPAGVFARMEKARAYGFDPAHYDEVIDAVERGGKTVLELSAKAKGALVKSSGRYDYRILKSDEKVCEIEFTDRGENPFVESMTVGEADKAGYTKGFSWKSMPKLMLFYRTLSQGVRRYCPDVLGGADGYDIYELEPFGFQRVDEADAKEATEKTEGETIEGWDEIDTGDAETLAKVMAWCRSDKPGDDAVASRALSAVKRQVPNNPYNAAFELEFDQADTATRKKMLIEVVENDGIPAHYGAIPKQEEVQEI